VNEMYDLLDAYEVKIPAADAVKKDDLKEAREALALRTGEADNASDGKMGQMTATLEKSISNLNEDLVGISTGLEDGDYVDPTVDPKLVLERLQSVQEQMVTINEKAEGFKTMQETFAKTMGGDDAEGFKPNDFKELKNAQAMFDQKMEIWTKLDTWNEQVYSWKSADFRQLEVEDMVKEVQVHFKDVLKMSKKPGAMACPTRS